MGQEQNVGEEPGSTESAVAKEFLDSEIAKALLTGDEQLLEIWNQKDWGRIPNLERIDLRAHRLRDVDFKNANLRNADLRDAVLFGANLTGCDLTGANLSNARLEGSLLVRAKLLNARLSGASLRWANLSGADLRNAKLDDTALSAARLGGADLTAALLTEETLVRLNDDIGDIEKSGEHPRHVFFALSTLCGYSLVAAYGASSTSLVANQGQIELPIIDTSVSPHSFFFLIPVLCLLLGAYVATHLRHLMSQAILLPARFPDGLTLAEKLSPWMQNAAPWKVSLRPVLKDGSDAGWTTPSWTRKVLVLVTQWLVPVTSTLLLVCYARARQPLSVMLLIALVCTIWGLNYRAFHGNHRVQPRRYFSIGGMLVAIAAIYAVNPADYLIPRLTARGQDLSGTILTSNVLRNADMAYANLTHVAVTDTDLSGAILFRSQLRQSGWRRVALHKARLNWANFTESFLAECDLSDAQLVSANLRGTELHDVSLRRSSLIGVDFSEATLDCVDLRGADLTGAMLQGLSALSCWCDSSDSSDKELPAAIQSCCASITASCKATLDSLTTGERDSIVRLGRLSNWEHR